MKSSEKVARIEGIYEDNHLIAVNKPNGVPVQRDSSEDEALVDMVKAYIKKEYKL